MQEKKDDYIVLIRDKSDRYEDKLLNMLNHYNVNSLKDLSLEQVKKYYVEYIK